MPEMSGKTSQVRRHGEPTPTPSLEIGGTRVASDVLMQGRREVVIVHDGSDYRLRVTSNNKLILTK